MNNKYCNEDSSRKQELKGTLLDVVNLVVEVCKSTKDNFDFNYDKNFNAIKFSQKASERMEIIEQRSSNPIIKEVINFLSDIYKISNENNFESNEIVKEKYDQIYKKFTDFQKDYPFKLHKIEYLEAGVKISEDEYFDENDNMTLDVRYNFPTYLYEAYKNNGKTVTGVERSFEERCGYLYGEDRVSLKDFNKIKEIFNFSLHEKNSISNTLSKIRNEEKINEDISEVYFSDDIE